MAEPIPGGGLYFIGVVVDAAGMVLLGVDSRFKSSIFVVIKKVGNDSTFKSPKVSVSAPKVSKSSSSMNSLSGSSTNPSKSLADCGKFPSPSSSSKPVSSSQASSSNTVVPPC